MLISSLSFSRNVVSLSRKMSFKSLWLYCFSSWLKRQTAKACIPLLEFLDIGRLRMYITYLFLWSYDNFLYLSVSTSLSKYSSCNLFLQMLCVCHIIVCLHFRNHFMQENLYMFFSFFSSLRQIFGRTSKYQRHIFWHFTFWVFWTLFFRSLCDSGTVEIIGAITSTVEDAILV